MLSLLRRPYHIIHGPCACAMFPFLSPVVRADAGIDGDHSREGSFVLASRKDSIVYRELSGLLSVGAGGVGGWPSSSIINAPLASERVSCSLARSFTDWAW